MKWFFRLLFFRQSGPYLRSSDQSTFQSSSDFTISEFCTDREKRLFSSINGSSERDHFRLRLSPHLQKYLGEKGCRLFEEKVRHINIARDLNSELHMSPMKNQCHENNLPKIPGFKLLSELGHGGMGIVYLAEQISLGRLVAIKMITGSDFADKEKQLRFEREANVIGCYPSFWRCTNLRTRPCR